MTRTGSFCGYAVPSMCPKQRSATVANGQQRSVAEAAELCHRPLVSSPTVLPKLAVAAQLRGRDSAIVLPN